MSRSSGRTSLTPRFTATAAAFVAFILLASGCSGSGSGPKHSPKPSSTSVLTPVALTAQQGYLTVTLTWTEPSGGAAVASYNVFRDGALLFTVTAPVTTYTDRTAVPGKTYTYEVEAYGNNHTSERASTMVKTPIPPLTLARVEGDFDVRVKLLSQTNLSGASAFNLGWNFRPKCSTGACPVVWSDLDNATLRGTLTRKGQTYRGSSTGKFGTRCGRAVVRSTLTFSLKVVKAVVTAGEWHATRLSGTLTEYDAPQLGCGVGRASYAITANLLT
jgi:hypothetical protein